jgi:periplasmic divalent cation tolerance protein
VFFQIRSHRVRGTTETVFLLLTVVIVQPAFQFQRQIPTHIFSELMVYAEVRFLSPFDNPSLPIRDRSSNDCWSLHHRALGVAPVTTIVNQPSQQYGVVLVTAGSREEAGAIARDLVESRLAACVSVFPTHSVYTWKGEIHSEDEWQLVIKTELSRFADLEAKIRQIHSYEVPEIIALPILAGSPPYLTWISEQVTTPE